METERQIRALNERVNEMERQISDLQYQLHARPNAPSSVWKDFILAFVVVYVLIHVVVVLVDFFA